MFSIAYFLTGSVFYKPSSFDRHGQRFLYNSAVLYSFTRNWIFSANFHWTDCKWRFCFKKTWNSCFILQHGGCNNSHRAKHLQFFQLQWCITIFERAFSNASCFGFSFEFFAIFLSNSKTQKYCKDPESFKLLRQKGF